MTTEVVVVRVHTPFKEVVRALDHDRISGVPVIDGDGVLAGVVSEADLLRNGLAGVGRRGVVRSVRRRLGIGRGAKPAATTAGDLLTSPAVTVSADASVAQAARLLVQHGIKRLPVVDAAGRLVGIASAGDLLRVFLRPDRELADEIGREVFERGLGVMVNPTTVHVDVREGVARLRGELEYRSMAQAAVAMTRSIDGIVDVEDELTFTVDDAHHRLPRVDERLVR
ncbi:MAG TPA: CBS domain-containing protein [Actinocrinis sp.]|nr:CBS domain-containing protein [Actinocrinis sp.]